MWKKALLCFVVIVSAVYLAGVVYFHGHYYLNTTINGFDAGGKKPEDIYQKEKEKKYTITVHELEQDEAINNPIQIKGKDYYRKVLQTQKPWLWISRFYQTFDLNSDEVYQLDEESLNEEIKTLAFMTEERKARNAGLEYAQKSYKVIKEVIGEVEDKEKAASMIRDAAAKREESVDIRSLYKQPKITSESEVFIKAKDTLDKYLASQITIKQGDKTVVLEADTIHKFLCWDKKFKTWISEDLVKDWVENNVSTKFNTVGIKRTIKSPGSGKFTVSGGSFGYQVWIDKTTDKVIKSIKKGETTTIEPEYLQKGDLGDDYVDISLSDQKLWVVKNGKVKLSSPIVSGNISTGHGTKTGTYFVEYKTTNYTMRRYNAFVHYWMPFDTGEGVGLHDATWRGSFGGSIYRTNGSHGCINLPPSKAKEIYSIVPTNYPVIVHW